MLNKRLRAMGLVAVLAATMAAQTTGQKPDMEKELNDFKAFIQEHPRALDELKKDPSLIQTAGFSDEHQAVREYLQAHAKVKVELKKYPHFFDNLKATNSGGQKKGGGGGKQ